jgi:hypothetical protein
LLPPSSSSSVLASGASNFPDVPSSGCLLPSPSPLPLAFCSIFVPGGDLWCVAFIDLIVLPLGMSADFGGFHPNSPPGFLFCVLRRFPLPTMPPTVCCWIFLVPPAMCSNAPCHNGFSASWRLASPPFDHWVRAYLASPPH